MTGGTAGDGTMFSGALIANLIALAVAVAELRQAQQPAAARAAETHLQAATAQARSSAPRFGRAEARRNGRAASAADVARSDFPVPLRPGRGPETSASSSRPRPHRGPLPTRRAGPGR
jgi:hypothetical protein